MPKKPVSVTFGCHQPELQYAFQNGTTAAFTQGEFTTSDPEQIAELDAEVASEHPQIFRKES